MKTQLGIGAAILSTLVAEGKNFNRDELNAMLDRLAASPEPKIRFGPFATCYVVALPQATRFEYVCKKCGMHTVYRKNRRMLGNALARYRDGAAKLRALGLYITIDESVLCRNCHSAKELGIPTRGKVVAIPTLRTASTDPSLLSTFDWRVGDEVGIESYASRFYYVYPLGESDDERESRTSSRRIFAQCLGEFAYDEGREAAIGRFDRLAWVINGKRTIIRSYNDIEILEAFLSGKKVLKGEFGSEQALKRDLPRLRELLGPVSESDGLVPKEDDSEIKVETDL